MSLVRRKIDVQFQLGTGSFGAGAGNAVALSGLKCVVSIDRPGAPAFSTMKLRVYGMTLSDMAALTVIGNPVSRPVGRKNIVTVTAGDDNSGMPVVFTGEIKYAFVDPSATPEVAFSVDAYAGAYAALKPIPATSYPQPTDAKTILQALAGQMNLDFADNGVTCMLSNPYYPGTAMQQAQAVARHANIAMSVDNGKMSIWPKDKASTGDAIQISGDTGLVGYPSFTDQGIKITTVFNPSITYFSQVQVQSMLPQACGTWTVYNMQVELESETPDGKWFTHMECNKFGGPSPIS